MVGEGQNGERERNKKELISDTERDIHLKSGHSETEAARKETPERSEVAKGQSSPSCEGTGLRCVGKLGR